MDINLDKTVVTKSSASLPIYHISYQNTYLMNASVIRIAEMESKKNSTYTYEELMDKFTSPRGEFTYFEDYNGYAIDQKSVRKFYRIYKNRLNKKESFLGDLIEKQGINLHFNCRDKFLIIFTHVDDPEYESTFNHEICHALYALDESYMKEADKLINCIPGEVREKLHQVLIEWGYPIDDLNDELNAYLSTSHFYWIKESWLGKKNFFTDYISIMKSFRKLLGSVSVKHGIELEKLPSVAVSRKRIKIYDNL